MSLADGNRAAAKTKVNQSPMTELTPDVIHRLPKTDLHVHLDGSLRIPTLIDLAKER
jgi:adenosine deaminase